MDINTIGLFDILEKKQGYSIEKVIMTTLPKCFLALMR